MAVYYKHRSEKKISSVPVSEPYISVADLKQRIMKSSCYVKSRRAVREDLLILDMSTSEEYVDESALIPQHSTVLVRRVPSGRPCQKITTLSSGKVMEGGLTAPTMSVAAESATKTSTCTTEDDDEEAAIRAVIDGAELKRDDSSSGSGYNGRRFMPGHHLGRGLLEGETPPPGYVCRRCRVAGHFIQLCPTNGDSRFDLKRTTRAVVPVMSAGDVDGVPAELLPAASASLNVKYDLPANPELHCPLCKKVMKDAAMTAKCCFCSFCDGCIRDYIINQSSCICGAKTTADDIVPNTTLRSTITRKLATGVEYSSSSTAKLRSSSGSNPDSKSESHTLAAASEKDSLVNVSSTITEDNQLAQPPEKCATVDLQSRAEADSARIPAQETSKSSSDALETALRPSDEPAPALNPTKKRKKADASSDTREPTPGQNPATSGVQPEASGTKKAKSKRKKADSYGSGFADTAGYGYGMPFDAAYYDPFFGGLPWGADPYMYGMPYAGYPMGMYYPNATGNILPQAQGMQGYPASSRSKGFQSSVYHNTEAAGRSEQAERPRDAGLHRYRSAEQNEPSGYMRGAVSRRPSDGNRQSGYAHRAESRSRTRLDSEERRPGYTSKRSTDEDLSDAGDRSFKRSRQSGSYVAVV